MIKAADTEEVEETDELILDMAYILSDDSIVSAEDYGRTAGKKPLEKAMPGSAQKRTKDNTKGISINDAVHPPLPPHLLSKFLEADEIHFRCVKVKVTDSVGREWMLVKPRRRIVEDSDFNKQRNEVLSFLDGANEVHGWEGVFEQAAMDYESVGWGAVEVVRSFDKKIKHLYHIPPSRIRVLKGWKGFVELGRGPGQSVFYVPFGQKVVSPSRRKLDGTFEAYDPLLDGPDIANARWNLRDRKNLNDSVGFRNIKRSANEILYIPKVHPQSIYYGLPDFVPAIGSIMGNVNIRDFFLQFFDHNTVPQYAVIIKGAKLSDEVKQLIMNYFAQEVKGHAHKTLVIPIPAAGGDVEVEFKALSTGVQEGSFQETRKNNQNAIIIAHGLSPAIIGMVETASLGSGKGSAQQENYKNRVVDPLQKRWSRAINRLFRHGLGTPDVNIEFDSLDPEDRTKQRQNLVAFVEAGMMSINEARARGRMGEPLSGGDRPYILKSGIPIFVDELAGAPDQLSDPNAMPVLPKAVEKGDRLERIAKRNHGY